MRETTTSNGGKGSPQNIIIFVGHFGTSCKIFSCLPFGLPFGLLTQSEKVCLVCDLTCIAFIKVEVHMVSAILSTLMRLYICTVFENHSKSLIQHCERSELRLHFEWTKVHQKCQKWSILANFLKT